MKKVERENQKQMRRSVRKPRKEKAREELDAFLVDQHRQRDAMLKRARDEKLRRDTA